MFYKFGIAIGLLMADMVLGGGNTNSDRRSIKVRDLLHSAQNLKLRDIDADKNALAEQRAALTASITRGRGIGNIDPQGKGENGPNWRPDSIFTVEPATPENVSDAKKYRDGAYAVLAGSHRLEFLEEAASIDPRWLDFEVPCIVEPAGLTDDQRDLIIIKNNDDGPEEKTVIKMKPVTRFQRSYKLMPRCDYICEMVGKGEERTAAFVKGTPDGWSSGNYQRVTGIGGSNHVPFSSMTRLGRHFDIPVEVFNETRLRVKSQVTAALLTKETPIGKGSAAVNGLGKGLETRYKEARAQAARQKGEEVKALFKAEFMALMDIANKDGEIIGDGGKGDNALGNTADKTPEERKADKEAKAAEEREAANRGVEATANGQKYAFQRWSVGNAYALKGFEAISPNLGNAMDLMFHANPNIFDDAALVLGAYKANPTNAETANAAALAIAKALKTLATPEPEQVAQAARGEKNTAKHNKHKGK